MRSELQSRFDAAIEQARQIQTNPINVRQAPAPANFKTPIEKCLDHNKVCEWIFETAIMINGAFSKGDPVRDEWDAALKRVPTLDETKHFHKLNVLLEKAAIRAGTVSDVLSSAHPLRDDELADRVIWDLYEMRDEEGCEFVWIALTHGVANLNQIRRVGEILHEEGLLKHHLPTSTGVTGYISAKAVGLCERLGQGKSIMDHIHNQASGKGNVHFHGSVDRSNLAVHSAGVSQSLNLGTDAKDLLGTLVALLERDEALSETQRSEALQDASTVQTELEKAKPNWKVVSGLLTGLGAFTSIVEIVEKIKKSFGL
jgi:hypothetical protein